MYIISLDKSTVKLYASKHYCLPAYSFSEFEKDFKGFVIVNSLIRRYTEHGTINIQLVMNRIQILYNVFGNNATRILFYHVIEYEHRCVLKAILESIYKCPEIVRCVPDTIFLKNIRTNKSILELIKKF